MKTLNDSIITLVARLDNSGFCPQTTAHITGVDVSTIYRWKRECPRFHRFRESISALSEPDKIALEPFYKGADLGMLRIRHVCNAYLQGHSVKEINAATNIPIPTLRNYLQKKEPTADTKHRKGLGYLPTFPDYIRRTPKETSHAS